MERVWSDLRSLTLYFEGYSTDHDAYAGPDWPREGAITDLDQRLGPAYEGSYPRATPPRIDPWGHPYRFVISNSRKQYALYSLGPSGKADPAATRFLERLRRDQIGDADLTRERGSANIVVASGMLVFAPADVLQVLVKARAEHPRFMIHREAGASRDVELLAMAVELYLSTHDGLPKELRGKIIDASALRSSLHSPIVELELSWIDPWKRPYKIAISPSGLRSAVYTLGEHNALSAEDQAMVQHALHGTLSTGTSYGSALMTTSLVPHVSE